jgi:hypothetical protein
MDAEINRPSPLRNTPARTAGMLMAALSLLPITAHAQGERRGMADMRIAERYAGRAANAQGLEEIRANLQQALNCLEGPRGPDFRRSAGDPCGGAGVVNELPDGSVNKIRVEKAIRLAAVGVTFHDFDPAHYKALAVGAVLVEGTG